MNVTLQFTVASPLSATGALTDISSEILSYTAFDGRVTLTDADSDISLLVNIDAATGLPTEWSINATNEVGKSVGDIINRMGMVYHVFFRWY